MSTITFSNINFVRLSQYNNLIGGRHKEGRSRGTGRDTASLTGPFKLQKKYRSGRNLFVAGPAPRANLGQKHLMQPGTNFHAQSTGHDEYRLKFTCKRPENRSLRRLTTEGGDAVAGIDGRFSRPVIVGIKSSTGANLGGRTHGHMAA